MNEAKLDKIDQILQENPEMINRLSAARNENEAIMVLSEFGFDLSPEDAESLMNEIFNAVEAREMSDDDLLSVTGGAIWPHYGGNHGRRNRYTAIYNFLRKLFGDKKS